MDKRVIITGAGMVSAIGIGREAFEVGLHANRSGIADRTLFDAAARQSRTAAEIRDFDIEAYLERPKAYLDRASALAFAGLSLALEDANIDEAQFKGNARIALALGSAAGNLQTQALFVDDLLNKGPRFVKPFLFPHTYANTSISLLAIDYGIKGPHLHFASGAVASAQALAAGINMIRTGQADRVLAGGFEALSDPLATACEAAGVVSPCGDGPERSAPFDPQRNGCVLGEGCGIVVLEEAEHARQRGASGRAEIAGVAEAAETTRRGDGLSRAMSGALAQAGWTPETVDWVCAAANGTLDIDASEVDALTCIFAQSRQPVAVSSLQSMLGETLGAGGALRICAALAAMEQDYIPYTVNLTAGPETAGIDWVVDTGRPGPLRRVLVNSADYGGSAVSIALTAV